MEKKMELTKDVVRFEVGPVFMESKSGLLWKDSIVCEFYDGMRLASVEEAEERLLSILRAKFSAVIKRSEWTTIGDYAVEFDGVHNKETINGRTSMTINLNASSKLAVLRQFGVESFAEYFKRENNENNE